MSLLFLFFLLEKEKIRINIFERHSSIYVCNIQFSSLVNYPFRGMQKKKIRTTINFTHILMTINGEKKSSSQNLPQKIIVKMRVKLICSHEITHFICIISPEAVDKINCKKTVTPPKFHRE